ncbi:unnamed protein product [Rotaria socialis]|uniref:Chitin-binding type-4 domain-containing protein n=2 Tax=Rotaria socialis TaxID=392032 RepID=A0A820N051_9BILA|nr:unnamed protein product [Rotaria socialis]CAF4380535.1 unnamed protein product [Rotaria socialis]
MFFLLVLIFCFLTAIDGHGYLYEPVARSTAWLVDSSFRECCTWPNHMEMFCGGMGHQWNTNDGKCSICGEAYDKTVKLFEKGGAMYKGTIVKTYIQGQEIDVKVMLTANHKGYFEFRLCNLDASPSVDASQECLDRHQLLIAGTDSTKFRNVSNYGSEMITVRVQLPSDVACQHCVFQWKYTAANSWGTNPITNQSGPGLGRENETFMGCSDIAILPNGSPTDPPIVIISTKPTITSTSTTTKTSTTTASSTYYWTWPSMTTTKASTTTASSTNHWTWPSLSTHGSSSASSTTTTTTTRRPLGLTTWSSDFFEYQANDEVMYDGIKYRCVVAHRSFPAAAPGPLTWAWWKPIQEEQKRF